jgi:hypothetical protein
MNLDSHCQMCGWDTGITPNVKHRSYPHLKRYFAKLRIAYENWPGHNAQTGEIIEFSPADPIHLRKWAQVEAGYMHTKTIVLKSTRAADIEVAKAAIEAAITAVGEYPFVHCQGQIIHVRASKSINYLRMKHLAFCDLDNKTTDVIYALTGLDLNALMEARPT